MLPIAPLIKRYEELKELKKSNSMKELLIIGSQGSGKTFLIDKISKLWDKGTIFWVKDIEHMRKCPVPKNGLIIFEEVSSIRDMIQASNIAHNRNASLIMSSNSIVNTTEIEKDIEIINLNWNKLTVR